MRRIKAILSIALATVLVLNLGIGTELKVYADGENLEEGPYVTNESEAELYYQQHFYEEEQNNYFF